MDTKSLLFKLDGHNVERVNNLYDWAEWMDSGELTVDYTSVGNRCGVSPVFLGMPPPREGDGPPLVFETALMRGDVPAQCVERYATWDEAIKGHEKWVRKETNRMTTPKQSARGC